MFKIAFFAAAAVLADPASAQKNGRSVQVDYRDLDLTSGHGLATMDHRIDVAVRQVCLGIRRAHAEKSGTAEPRPVAWPQLSAEWYSQTLGRAPAASGSQPVANRLGCTERPDQLSTVSPPESGSARHAERSRSASDQIGRR